MTSHLYMMTSPACSNRISVECVHYNTFIEYEKVLIALKALRLMHLEEPYHYNTSDIEKHVRFDSKTNFIMKMRKKRRFRYKIEMKMCPHNKHKIKSYNSTCALCGLGV